MPKNPLSFFSIAFEQAQSAFARDEVPVGAALVKDGVVIASASNRMRQNSDATAHAEMLCLREACQLLKTQQLTDCDLYVTLEPCAMCAGAIANARVRRVFFGAYDEKGGGVDHGARVFDYALHKPEVIGGVNEVLCGQLLSDFFKQKR
ncbi:MAG: nucleoside deaminase [Alphaproteobacteria bacterium]|nr:nucleoside deaminase [Alphaproteobacteria bacterium]